MKKTNKVLVSLLVIILLFEFICTSNPSLAITADAEVANNITNLCGGLVSILLWIPRIITVLNAWVFGAIMTQRVAASCGYTYGSASTGGYIVATPFEIFFNKYKLLDVDFFDFTANGSDQIVMTIRNSVAEWFYVLRTISASVLLVVLIYVGIRMALSTVATDKAMYKKMLWDWCCSLALIFVLQYICIFTIAANNAIVEALRQVAGDDIHQAMGEIAQQATLGIGIGSIVATIVYVMVVFQTVMFMITYIQRMLKVAFLIIISPLISITYSIDKMGDGKAQALNTWFKEFVYTILIQPFHCILYLAFAKTAINILRTGGAVGLENITALFDSNYNQLANGIFVILCFKFINDGEKALRKIFNFQDDSSLTSMAAGAVVAVAAVKNAQKLGGGLAKSKNAFMSTSQKFRTAIYKDGQNKDLQGKLGKWKDRAANSKVGKFAGKAGEKVSGAAKAIGNSPVGQTVGNGLEKLANGKVGAFAVGALNTGVKAISGAKTLGGKALKAKKAISKSAVGRAIKKSTPVAMAMMGAAAAYSAGNTDVVSAFGIGAGMKKGTEEYMKLTESTSEENGSDQVSALLEQDQDYQDAKAEVDEADKEIAEEKETQSELKDQAMAGVPERRDGTKPSYKEMREDWKNLQKQRAKRDADPGNSLARLDAEEYENNFRNKYGVGAENIMEQVDKSESKVASLTSSRDKSKEKMKTAAEKQLDFMKKNGSEAQVERAKSEMGAKLQQFLQQRKLDNVDSTADQDDSNTENTLTSDEQSSIERMQDTMANLIDRSIIGSGGKFDAAQFVSNNFRDLSAEEAQSLVGAMQEYERQRRAMEYKSSKKIATGAGVDADRFDNRVMKKVGRNIGVGFDSEAGTSRKKVASQNNT